jgi:hypothetical protein
MSMPKRVLIFALSAAGLLAGPVAVRAADPPAAGVATTRPVVTKVEAVCKEGRTYVVFRKANQAEGDYLIFRSLAPIKDSTGLARIPMPF